MAALRICPREIFVIIILTSLCSTRAMGVIDSSDEQEVDEYYLDHEISEQEAFLAARNIDFEETPVGCKECTVEQLVYCFGNKLLDDHCCCDKRYSETLPFIPHSCYLPARTCTLHAANCGEYHRIKRCCCDAALRKKWKARSSANGVVISINLLTIVVFFNVVLYTPCT